MINYKDEKSKNNNSNTINDNKSTINVLWLSIILQKSTSSTCVPNFQSKCFALKSCNNCGNVLLMGIAQFSAILRPYLVFILASYWYANNAKIREKINHFVLKAFL